MVLNYQYYNVKVLIGNEYYTIPVKTKHVSINQQLEDINKAINTKGHYGTEILVSITNITEQEYRDAITPK